MSTTTLPPAHCDKGAYCGGIFVPIEDLGGKYTFSTTQKKRIGNPVRSRTRHVSSKKDGSYDIVIIGGGVVGCAVARELSKTKASVLLLEADDDVGQGATKGNSGIVHAGYDDKPGSVRAKYCWPGNQMFPKLDEELNFGYFKNGSLVVARGKEEEKALEALIEQGKLNGVERLSIIRGDELKKLEPFLTEDATAALRSPDAGIVIPYEFSIALAENAADNGVEVRIRRKVVGIDPTPEGNGYTLTVDYADAITPPRDTSFLALLSIILAAVPFVLYPKSDILLVNLGVSLVLQLAVALYYFLTPSKPSFQTTTEKIRTRFVVNAAGGNSAAVAQMVGDNSFKMEPRTGEYLLAHKSEGLRVRHTLFPVPSAKGKGILAQRTLWGNFCYGPTARDSTEPTPTPIETISFLLIKCRELVPSLDASKIFHSFTGVRSKTSRHDWIIEESKPGFISAAGIDSPGLAGSPAIALEVVRLLKVSGCTEVSVPNPSFNPNRPSIVTAKDGWRNLKLQKSLSGAFDCKNPRENVICKCEKVTEAEVVEAIHRSLPVDNTQAIRRRTRAGMGDCQGRPDNYDCEARVKKILERELGSSHVIGTRQWPASSLLPQRWMTDEEKQKIGQ